MQEVERLLLEARMTNARLMEDNESFQLLLQEKTLNGDFAKSEFMGGATDALSALEGRAPMSSLADELNDAAEEDTDKYRRLESELKSQKDQNKALTLYINKIIERLLQHQDFEAILDQSSDFEPGTTAKKSPLPLPSPAKEPMSGASILKRAKSIALGSGVTVRPQSQVPTSAPSHVNNPETAPSIPFGHRRGPSIRQRPTSDQFSGGPQNVVNQMYRGGQTSPLNAPHGDRNSSTFFPTAGARKPSIAGQTPLTGTFPGAAQSDASSISGESGEVNTPSPPRVERTTTSFGGNKPRPLRLVQDQSETTRQALEDEKKAKRASWVGWAFGNRLEPTVTEETGKDHMSLKEEEVEDGLEESSGMNHIF